MFETEDGEMLTARPVYRGPSGARRSPDAVSPDFPSHAPLPLCPFVILKAQSERLASEVPEWHEPHWGQFLVSRPTRPRSTAHGSNGS